MSKSITTGFARSAAFTIERKAAMSEEEQKRKEEIFSTTGTIRDQLPELEETNVVFMIPIGGDADEFQ